MIIDPEEHELTAVLARLPDVSHCRVVEIGCGNGRLTRRYRDRVASVLATDPDDRAIAEFRASGAAANVDVRALAIERLDLPDQSLDVALFSWAL